MSVTLQETGKSRGGKLDDRTASADWKYIGFVSGESDPEGALVNAVLLVAPFQWKGCTRQSVSWDHLGGGVYDVTVPYALLEGGYTPDPTQPAPGGTPDPNNPYPAEPKSPGNAEENDQIDLEISVELTGQPVKLLQSIFTLSKTATPGWTPLDHKGALNVGPDGKVDGVDSMVPVYKWSATKVFPNITWRFMKLLRSMYGKTNIKKWGVWEADEARFVGCSFSKKPDGTVPIKFDFEAIESEENIDIGNGIVVPKKPGHYYLWVDYGKGADQPNGTPTVPKCAYVERVFRHDDFRKLGLGG